MSVNGWLQSSITPELITLPVEYLGYGIQKQIEKVKNVYIYIKVSGLETYDIELKNRINSNIFVKTKNVEIDKIINNKINIEVDLK